jgi:parallel beta-helix repeat protein
LRKENRKLERKAVSGIMLISLFISMLTLAFNIQSVKASGTIYIRADGSIDPPTAPIYTEDNITYTFTDNIYDEIMVERSNIIVDGNGYTVHGTGFGTGLYLYGIGNVTIKRANIKGFKCGIHLEISYFNTISGNNIINNGLYGILLHESSNNSIFGNDVATNNWYGVSLYKSSSNSIFGNNIANNWENGIRLDESLNNNISGNNIANNEGGISLYKSSNNSIFGNEIITNHWHGIQLLFKTSSNNSIFRNNITANHKSGIRFFYDPINNVIFENNIANNEYGIRFFSASNNIFYHNNFIENTYQAKANLYVNVWDDGYPSGGNYWSDYEDRYPDAEELDDSGIWDTPYVIDENNQDNYPLIEPWTPKPPSPLEALDELIQTVESYNLDTGIETSLTSELQAAYRSLDMEKQNASIGQLTAFINEAEALRDKKLTNEQAEYLIAEAQRIIDLIKR